MDAAAGIFLARPAAPQDGIRLAVKDLLDTEALVTTYGSAIFVDHVPTGTAEAVSLAEAAGYANVGKTNLHEFAYGITSVHEVATVHRELYAEQEELYGEELAVKIERCLAVSDAEAADAEQARSEYRERCEELIDELDLLLTPTLQCVAPPVGIGDLALRERLLANTLPFNALGWPALALPCGPAEDGLPASIQLVGRPGSDEVVLAAAARLF
ncbi:MAG: amidase family protein [Actinomycetota bacterium]|nr:amidase family protein [Actinomycetota bacterium]